jgi:MoxR-like ATPase
VESTIEQVTERIQKEGAFLHDLRREMERVIVGQEELVEALLIALLADGHVLLEGLPGLAKSLAVETLARALGGTFRRIQFTPDLLPSDLLGTHVYHPDSGAWTVREGPVFSNFLLADEINRAPAKVQSALLEAMQERQVSLAGDTRELPDPFLVLATQNPVELEGTYALPEAQIDRFMLKVLVHHPTRSEESLIIERMAHSGGPPRPTVVADPQQILAARALLDEVLLSEAARQYIIDLVFATREPAAAGLPHFADLILYGASPRASLSLAQASRAHAFLRGRAFVTPEDIKAIAPEVLRHRIVTTYEAEAEGVSVEDILNTVLDTVPVP